MLQSIFGIQRLSRDDPLSNVRSLRAWAIGVPRNDPVAAVEQIATRIREEAVRPEGSAMRLEALVELDRIAAPLVDLMRTQYRQITISDDIRQKLLSLCESIAQGFAQSYAHYAKDIEASQTPVTPRDLRHAVFARFFHHQAMLARLGLFRYEQWIPGRWRGLHQAYRVARQRALATEPFSLLPSRASEQSSAEQEYVGILLLHRLNSGNLTTPQIDWASEWLREWVATLRLAPPPQDFGAAAGNGYWIDLGEGEGLTERHPTNAQGEVLFLDMEPFRAQLKALIGRLMSQGLGGRMPTDSDDALTLAKRVDRLWQPQAPTMQRRGERRPASVGATVAAGFSEVVLALQSRHARSAAPTGYHYDERGRLRNNAEGARRIERYTWQAVDSSDSGYRLRSSAREATRQWPGALLGLQVEDVPGWQLAVVRRLRRIGADLTEIGVEVISRNVSLAMPREIETRDSGYTVDGVDVEVTGKGFQAIYLPSQVQGRVRAPASLVITPSEFSLHRRLSLTVEGQSHTILLASPLERTRDWVWAPLRSG